ncbi:hypothetical protein DL767_002957 [Monosporascus sp. MG133]|nr:hypothetical protein DL767_002957 [Monosporascus sp. MG133]
MWDEWNGALAADSASAALDDEEERELPPCAGRSDWRLWLTPGVLRMSSRLSFSEFELQTLGNMEKEGIRESQFRDDDEAGESVQPVKNFIEIRRISVGGWSALLTPGPGDRRRAREETGWDNKIDPCRRREIFGVHKRSSSPRPALSTFTKSCPPAEHLARKAGVEMIFDPDKKVGSFPRHENGLIKIGCWKTKIDELRGRQGPQNISAVTAHVVGKKAEAHPHRWASPRRSCAGTPDSIDDSFFADYVPGRKGSPPAWAGASTGSSPSRSSGARSSGHSRGKGRRGQQQQRSVYGEVGRWRGSSSAAQAVRSGLEEGESRPGSSLSRR